MPKDTNRQHNQKGRNRDEKSRKIKDGQNSSYNILTLVGFHFQTFSIFLRKLIDEATKEELI